MGFEPMNLWLYTLSILMGGGNAIWVQAHWLQVFNMPVLFQRYMYLFIWKELCMLHCFPYHCLFFFSGALSLWNNLWDKVILQLCFVHLLLVPSGNWLALNIICGLVVMEFACVLYILWFIIFFFLFFCFLGILHLFTLNCVFLQGHSKSAAPGWRIEII